jgi:hypothetical protein
VPCTRTTNRSDSYCTRDLKPASRQGPKTQERHRSKGQPGFIAAQCRSEARRKNRATVPPARTAREQNLGRKVWRQTEKSATEKILPGDRSGTKRRGKREALKEKQWPCGGRTEPRFGKNQNGPACTQNRRSTPKSTQRQSKIHEQGRTSGRSTPRVDLRVNRKLGTEIKTSKKRKMLWENH